jgi:uncharacterized damage-inducible protein DinB
MKKPVTKPKKKNRPKKKKRIKYSIMPKPSVAEYPAFYKPYIDKIEAENIVSLINNYETAFRNYITNIKEEKALYAYDTNKWTINEVLQHLIDCERIFVYRALRFSRNDATPLPGFNENDYIKNANANLRSLQSLQTEWLALRESTCSFLLSLSAEVLQNKGIANNGSISVNAIAYIIFGHVAHHIEILKTRYNI